MSIPAWQQNSRKAGFYAVAFHAISLKRAGLPKKINKKMGD
jgi:hypothetical protein